MRANNIGHMGRRRDGGAGKIMSRIEKPTEKLFCLRTQNVTRVTGSGNQYSPAVSKHCLCAHRSCESEGQRRGPEDRRTVWQRGGHRPRHGPNRHGGPHPAGGGQ